MTLSDEIRDLLERASGAAETLAGHTASRHTIVLQEALGSTLTAAMALNDALEVELIEDDARHAGEVACVTGRKQ